MNANRLRAHGNRGQAMLEVALVTPLLLLLLAGAIDIGRLAHYDTLLASGARAGAQYGSLNLITADNTAGMTAAAVNDIPHLTPVTIVSSNFCMCPGSNATVACTATACSTTHRMLYVKVSVTGTFKPLFNLMAYTQTSRTRTAILQVGQ
jgi:Flp pilus assembly protein TadG